MMSTFNFVEYTFMVPYTKEVADYCDLFHAGMTIWTNSSDMMCFYMKKNCSGKHIVG